MIETNTAYTWKLVHPILNQSISCTFHDKESFEDWKSLLELIDATIAKYDKKD